MKKWIIILYFLHLSLGIEAQVFNNTYNNYSKVFTYPIPPNQSQFGREALYDFSFDQNEIVLIGSTSTPTWEDSIVVDAWLLKINQYGDTLFHKSISIDSNDVCVGFVPIELSNGIMLFGNAKKKFANTTSTNNGLVLRIDSTYNLLEHSLYDYGDFTNFVSACEINNFIYVLGYSDIDSSSNQNYELFITKFDSIGNPKDTFQFGGGDNEIGRSIDMAPNGNLLISGHTESFGAGDEDILLIEMDTLGNVVWQKTYGYPGTDMCLTNNILKDSSNYFYICGWTELNTGDRSAWLIKTDNLGNQIWEKKFNRGIFFDGFTGLTYSLDGNILLSGSTHDYDQASSPATGWLIKIDTTGNLIWERLVSKYKNQFSTDDYIYRIKIDNSGSIYLAGYILGGIVENGIYHDNDGWLCKTDSCGFTTKNPTEAMLVIDSIVDYTVYISNLSADYCTGQYTINGEGGLLDTANVYAHSQWTNGDNPNQLQYTFQDTGAYEITLNIIGGDSTDSYTVQFNILDTVSSIKPSVAWENQIHIFPNPVKDYLIIQTDLDLKNTVSEDLQCAIYTSTGRKLKSYALNPKLYQQRILIDDLSNGVYLLHFTLAGQSIGNKRISVVR